jgi:hypothetical protein
MLWIWDEETFLRKSLRTTDSGLTAFSLRLVSALARSALAMVHSELCRESSDRLYASEAVTLRDFCLRPATYYHLPFVTMTPEGREA